MKLATGDSCTRDGEQESSERSRGTAKAMLAGDMGGSRQEEVVTEGTAMVEARQK